MQSLYSFANHVGSLSTQAVQTRTHRFHSFVYGSTSRGVSANPAKFLFSDPALFSAGRRYPDFARATSVNDRQTPLSIQLKHVTVGNQFSSKGIDDFDHIISQNEFWFNPKNINNYAENEAKKQLADDLKIVVDNPESVNSKKDNKQVSSTGPSKVASRSKSFIHVLSIAGETK